MSHTIELRKVSKYYAGEDSVSMGFSRIDLDLDIGEFVAVTGESGSGKSTLLNVISGLDTYEEGEMFVCGEDTTAYSAEDYERYRKTYIGNIFQDFNLINSYTVYQNIEVVMLLSGKKKKECKAKVNDLIDQVGLSQYRNTKVSKLSGGQKQRVAIARALAKNAPIIVADEPTGNLDSASAEAVMETLAKVAKDKLVVIVTHNYEQAEPYATRKLTMHDGRIIEDKKIEISDAEEHTSVDQRYEHLKEAALRQEQNETNDEAVGTGDIAVPAPGKMRKSSELRLGVRNTFNLPAKFILLFIVYFFVSTAVLGQYATTKNSMHQTSMTGSNPYFFNTSAERMIVKKADESSFTESDIDAVRSVDNVRSVIKNDAALDSEVVIKLGDLNIEGTVASTDLIKADEITYGRMPQKDYEIVIKIDASADAYVSLATNGNDYIGKSAVITDTSKTQAFDFSDGITIAGIIIDEDLESDSEYSQYGYATVFAGDAVSNDILVSLTATISDAEMSFAGTRIVNDYGRAVYSSPKVPDGKVYIFEDETYYFEDEDVTGKTFSLKIKNRFFESEGKYKVDKIITDSNCKKLLGIPADEYDSYYNCVFVSSKDFRELFDKGIYQVSAFMINEQESDVTQQALNDMGFTTLAIKDSLSDSTGGLSGMLNLMTYGRLALELIILFFIAYAVIRLIMRSRNSYYSTLRILGASKGNTDSILRIELVLMMIIAYGVDLLFAVLVSTGTLQDLTGYKMEEAVNLLYYLKPLDYGILGALLLIMSLLIAGRYSGNIFEKSAMKAFREGV